MSRPGPAIVANLTAEQLQAIADAADFGHCLECGADVDGLAGEVLCQPCDELAAETEEGMAELAADMLPRMLAELEAPRLEWSLTGLGVWKLAPAGPAQGELAL